jgi:ABC-type nickel/cobalt efflux system permease component RcnA
MSAPERRAGPPRRVSWPALVLCLVAASPAWAHPLGNFSVNRYSALWLTPETLEVRYVLDLAEIPTFQEIQQWGISADPTDARVTAWAVDRVAALAQELRLEIDGRPRALRAEPAEVVFPPGAGGLPTLRLAARLRADLGAVAGPRTLRYRDGNAAVRAGWKEVVAAAGPGVAVLESSVPAADRSRALQDYPADLLMSPPQDVEAVVVFQRLEAAAPPAGESAGAVAAAPRARAPVVRAAAAAGAPVGRPSARGESAAREASPPPPAATPRSAFTELMSAGSAGPGVMLLALLVALGLGALHALEPGHGKTVVAAYLVGGRGTSGHAVLLGLIVTASHTAGVYLLGGVTLYASRFMVPERLYPWLGVASGVVIAALGATLFVRRCAAGGHHHRHHHHGHDHGHDHHHGPGPGAQVPEAGSFRDRGQDGEGDVTVRQLLALGVGGGIVPCPAALVVLLSAVSLGRIGFGLALIAAFSAGLAAVLVGVGLLVLHARRLMARVTGQGVIVTRWLPLTASAVITGLGLVLAVQALQAAGVLVIRLS